MSLTLEWTDGNTGIIKIYDSYGQTVKVLNVINGLNTVDISDLSPGLYFMHIKTSDGSNIQKFIKK